MCDYGYDSNSFEPKPFSVTLEDIDQATDRTQKLQLLKQRLREENAHSNILDDYYYVLHGIHHGFLRDLRTSLFSFDNESCVTAKLYVFHRNFYVGFINLRGVCLGIAKHDIKHDPHPSINRESCLEIKLQIREFETYFVSNYQYHKDATRFLENPGQYGEYTAIYSIATKTGRLTCSGPFHNYIPPFAAAYDGILPDHIVSTIHQQSEMKHMVDVEEFLIHLEIKEP